VTGQKILLSPDSGERKARKCRSWTCIAKSIPSYANRSRVNRPNLSIHFLLFQTVPDETQESDQAIAGAKAQKVIFIYKVQTTKTGIKLCKLFVITAFQRKKSR
jgi:hypothetical protein